MKRKKRFIPLRVRLIRMITSLLLLVLGALFILISYYQSQNIRRQLVSRGLAMAESLAAACKNDLATYNYIALEQNANQLAKDPDIQYVIIHDKEGRVAGYSGHAERQRSFLKDPLSSKALSSPEPLAQKGTLAATGEPIIDIAVPVFLAAGGERWGTVRVALSLSPMYRQIRQIQMIIAAIGLIALSFGVLVSIAAARRITEPLRHLVDVTVEAAKGNLQQEIDVHTGDEVEILADNFAEMISEILAQRRQLEQQLAQIKRLQRYTEQLLTTMHDGLFSVGADATIITMNPAAARVLDSPAEKAVGRPVGSVLGKFASLHSLVMEQMQRQVPLLQKELKIDKDGDERVLLVGSSVLQSPDGPTEFIFNIQDITELKRLEARIRQTERLAALGTLSAGMAHEIRNPLSAIKTFVQLLPRKLDKPGFLEKFQRTVPRELERINRLVEDLLELARDPKYLFAPVDVGILLKDVTELLEAECESHNITCEIKVSEAIPPVMADGYQLRKAFHNLIRNAVEAMPDGGLLRIQTGCVERDPADVFAEKPPGKWVVVSFKDTGRGISDESLKNIFNPFFTTKDTGTGLGLAITHKVITEHGGYIEVVSEQGSGTTFIIELPAAPSQQQLHS